MNFRLSEEQGILRDSMRRYCENEATMEARLAASQSPDGYSKESWKAIADLGWLAVPFTEDQGGLGGDPVDLMVVGEEFGRGLLAGPYQTSVVWSGAALRASKAPIASSLIEKVISGDVILGAAFSESSLNGGGCDVATTATKTASGFTIEGAKSAVLYGDAADAFVVSAKTKDGIGVYVVPADAKGVTVVGFPTVDGQRAAEVTFEAVEIDSSHELAGPETGEEVCELAYRDMLLFLGAEAVGLMDAITAQTVQYAKERKQFGVHIGAFQVLQHRMVDMTMECELSRSVLYMAAIAHRKGGAVADRAVCALKAQVGRSGRFVGQSAIQTHGGMGMSEEVDVSHFFKRLTCIDVTCGTGDSHLRWFAQTRA